jgi:DNA-3-methyladenine glycosylase II
MATKTKQAGTAHPGQALVTIRTKGPFNLRLSLEAAASFFPDAGPPLSILRVPAEIDGETSILEIWQSSATSSVLHAKSTPPSSSAKIRAIAKWLVSADLDLCPFYALARRHSTMDAVVRSLPGLKPLRPATLFEMAVVAITEQQLSLAAAFHIRTRLVRRFGVPLGGLLAFPPPEKLAAASLRDLCACGLSERKAEYVRELALRTREGGLDFETLRRESDERIREVLVSSRGFGEWSAEYILGRGFGRADSLPADDTGLRRVVGRYLAGGRALTPAELAQALAPFKPFRGLAAYYLAVHWRLRRVKQSSTSRPAPNLRGQRSRDAVSPV